MNTRWTAQQALEPTADPAWVLDQHGFDPLRDSSRESRFAISNGFLGVRGGRSIDRLPNPDVPPRTYVAGLFDVVGADQPMTALVPAPDWLKIDVSLAGHSDGPTISDASFHRRILDFKRGALLTHSRVAGPQGLVVRLCVLRLVSLHCRALGLQVIEIAVDAGEAEATLEASFEGLEFGLVTERLEQERGAWRTNASGKRLAMAQAATLRVDGQVVAGTPVSPFKRAWTWSMRPGQAVRFERTVAVALGDGAAEDVAEQAQQHLAAAAALGWTGVLGQHEASWARRWRDSDVVVGGDPAAQHALRFALYHLNGAANPQDDHVSIAARALTGADYHGHVFWDTEIFLLPFYTLTWPEAARALLLYRFNTLDGARAKARRMGWRGAMYAWESADTGAETCPEHGIASDRRVVPILCGTQELHISADVAYAVWHYWKATADEAFLRDAGAEILLETARFWASRAQLEADGKHHIRGVIGPDEYHETIDDNAFTNVMARWTIRRGLDVAALLRRRWPDRWASLSASLGLADAELGQWSTVADTMLSGLDPATGLFEQFAGFFRLEPIDLAGYAGRSVPMDVVLGRERAQMAQVIKQADVVALVALLPEEFAGDGASVNFGHYEPLCSHGSSLSAALHGVAAARLGQVDMALRFFHQASATDLADTHAAIDGGVHIASLGGVRMIAVLGFAGLAVEEACLSLRPQLPAGWASLAFSVQWQGRHLAVAIDQAGKTVQAALAFGGPMTVRVGGQAYPLSVERPLVAAFVETLRPRRRSRPDTRGGRHHAGRTGQGRSRCSERLRRFRTSRRTGPALRVCRIATMKVQSMQQDDVVVAVFETHQEADAALKKLAAGGFAPKQLSLVGKGYHTEETVTGFYNFGDRVRFWGSRGAFWGGMWGFFVGGMFLAIPIVGHVMVLGYLAAAVISTIEGAVVFGGLGAIGGAIASMGIPEGSVLQYETAIKADDFLVMAHGSGMQTARAHDILASTHPKQIETHLLAAGMAREPAVA